MFRRLLLGMVLGLGLAGCYYYAGGYDVYSAPYYYPGYLPYYYPGYSPYYFYYGPRYYYGPRFYGGYRYYYWGGYGPRHYGGGYHGGHH